MPNKTKPAPCHPDRLHWARGFCQACYRADWKRRNPEKEKNRPRRPAPCHPDQPVWARELCSTCYRREYRSDPENLEREKAFARPRARRRYRENRLPTIIAKYGLKVEDWHRMVIEHGGRCAACNEPAPKLQIDHCHETGRVRALLCPGCNSAIAHAKENVERLRKLIAYLEAQAALTLSLTVAAQPRSRE